MSDGPTSMSIPVEGDGAVGSVWRRQPKRPVASIFVHAGAGYHSVVNERVHLKACTDAARVGMSFLRAGATATQAVEAAIRCLEDKEITNAGFGSNLNIDGVVECDATIVDHLGRSGACGAVPGVKNPISLAKKILDTSSRPLSLRRVPPNILVGEGAREFAEEQGIQTIRNEFLVSRNAKDRFLRWSEDLRRAEARDKSRNAFSSQYWGGRKMLSPADYEEAASARINHQLRDHASAVLMGTWNEGQPDSPDSRHSPVPENGWSADSTAPASTYPASYGAPMATSDPPRTPNRQYQNVRNFSVQLGESLSTPMRSVECQNLGGESPYLVHDHPSPASAHDGAMGCDDDEVNMVDDFDYYGASEFDASSDKDAVRDSGTDDAAPQHVPNAEDADRVTDTVGAIAIDLQGNIAAGSSSGGIGMKHRGRTGPAALVGVGTAVVPQDPDDDLGTSVAAVTSGTGEHMATCSASLKCAERLFQGTRRGPGGRDIAEDDEHAILESFIVDDFMGHPGVRDQPSAGAIGVMAVKKDRTGVYFYFAHNTDSFALASMASNEREPLCVMSRLGKTGNVAQGGRRVRVE